MTVWKQPWICQREDSSHVFYFIFRRRRRRQQVTGSKDHVQSYDEPVVIQGETDRLYLHPEEHPVVHAKIHTGTAGLHLRLEGAGQVEENVSTVSAVVWNPGPEKAAKMSDFDDEEYKDMICVEPGLIGHQPLLNPGAQARLSQSIIVVEE